jgi:hypothetical protein
MEPFHFPDSGLKPYGQIPPPPPPPPPVPETPTNQTLVIQDKIIHLFKSLQSNLFNMTDTNTMKEIIHLIDSNVRHITEKIKEEIFQRFGLLLPNAGLYFKLIKLFGYNSRSIYILSQLAEILEEQPLPTHGEHDDDMLTQYQYILNVVSELIIDIERQRIDDTGTSKLTKATQYISKRGVLGYVVSPGNMYWHIHTLFREKLVLVETKHKREIINAIFEPLLIEFSQNLGVVHKISTIRKNTGWPSDKKNQELKDNIRDIHAFLKSGVVDTHYTTTRKSRKQGKSRATKSASKLQKPKRGGKTRKHSKNSKIPRRQARSRRQQASSNNTQSS